VTLTYEPDVSPTDPDPLCSTVGHVCRADPSSALKIPDITGSFSDPTAGISTAPITALVPISPTNEKDAIFDPLVPTSLSYVGSLSYDNLFFPNGNPLDCEYPYDGTLLDVFGVAFTITGGDTAVVWGDGVRPADGPLALYDANGALIVGPTYGVGVLNADDQVVGYAFSGVNAAVPEPVTLSLFGVGLAGAVAMRRRRKKAMAA